MTQLEYSQAVDKLTGIKSREYRTVDTRTLAGIKQAERLHAAGWKTGSVGLFLVQFYR